VRWARAGGGTPGGAAGHDGGGRRAGRARAPGTRRPDAPLRPGLPPDPPPRPAPHRGLGRGAHSGARGPGAAVPAAGSHRPAAPGGQARRGPGRRHRPGPPAAGAALRRGPRPAGHDGAAGDREEPVLPRARPRPGRPRLPAQDTGRPVRGGAAAGGRGDTGARPRLGPRRPGGRSCTAPVDRRPPVLDDQLRRTGPRAGGRPEPARSRPFAHADRARGGGQDAPGPGGADRARRRARRRRLCRVARRPPRAGGGARVDRRRPRRPGRRRRARRRPAGGAPPRPAPAARPGQLRARARRRTGRDGPAGGVPGGAGAGDQPGGPARGRRAASWPSAGARRWPCSSSGRKPSIRTSG
jgi:hypothetical protein